MARWAIVAGASATAMLVHMPAFAQKTDALDNAPQNTARDSDGASPRLDEIVVTAQRREQRLQDVPISITALGATALEDARVRNIRDIGSLVPNLTVTTVSGGQGNTQYLMRGAIGNGSGPGQDKPVSVYIDGVYLGAANGGVFDVADLDRIEVLRGPQGTLFGRNSDAGAINITTRGPTGELRLKQDLSLGNLGYFRSLTRIDTPPLGIFSAALTYVHDQRRGDIRNLGAGTVWDFTHAGGRRFTSPDRLGGYNKESVAASLKAAFTDNFTVTYRFDHSQSDYLASGVGLITTDFSIYGPALGVAIAQAFATLPNMTPISGSRPDAVNNGFTLPARSETWGHIATADWSLGERVSLKNIFGYRITRNRSPGSSLDGIGALPVTPAIAAAFGSPALVGQPLLLIALSGQSRYRDFSNELQLHASSDWVDYTAGMLYFEQDQSIGGYANAPNLITFAPVSGYLIGPSGTDTRSPVKTTSYAGYMQAEFHLSPQFDLIGGIRYTHDKKVGIDRSLPAAPASYRYTDGRVTYMIGLNYKLNSDALLYTKYATGYISGGQLFLTYGAETAKSWEAGIKADWWDQRLRTNLAGFYVKYGNLQLVSSGAAFGFPQVGQVVSNAGSSRAVGFEFESTLKPLPSVTLQANLGYTHFKYISLSAAQIASGSTELSYRPHWINNYSAQWESDPIWKGAFVTLRVDASYKSLHSQVNTFTPFRPQYFIDAARVPAYWLVNARLSLSDVRFGGGQGSISLWGRNIFNNRSKTQAVDFVGLLASEYELSATYGIDFTIKF